MSDHDDPGQSVQGMPQSTLRGYMIGFWLSVVLTVIPFWLVLGDVLQNPALAIFFIIAMGTAQMIVHMIYFLHLNTKSENGWLIMSLAFTALLVVIAIAGSIWIMFHLDRNMMPAMMDTMSSLLDTMNSLS